MGTVPLLGRELQCVQTFSRMGKRRTSLVSTSASAGASAGSPTDAVEMSPRKTPHLCMRVRTGSKKNLPSSIIGNATTPKFIKTIKTP